MRLLRLLLLLTAGTHADSTTDRVPSPASFLGFEVGADRKLADWREITAYFNQLALVSDRVPVDTLGTSTLGRPFILLTISSPENLRRLDEYRAMQRKLADPRTIASAEERRRLLEKGRVIVCITSAIHAVEVGSGQAPLRIAYRLAHDSGESTQRILREAIILLIPSLNPVEPNVDPLIVSSANALGTAIAGDMHAAGKRGVVVNAVYDAWTPSRAYEHYHAGIRILTEAASARMATPIDVPFDSLKAGLGFDARERSWNFPDPWPGGTWRLADIVDYMDAGAFTLLRHVARSREHWLRTFWAIGEHAVRGWPDWPKAFVIPEGAGQNPDGLPEVLRILTTGGVEVRRARAAFRAAGESFPAGSYVVPLDQPYAAFAKALLEPERYPEGRVYPGGPLRRPHDVTAHTISLLMGVRAVATTESLSVALSDVVEPPPVRRVAPGLTHAPSAPRIGLYQSYAPALDEGWTRWIFDQYGIAYTTLHDADVRGRGDSPARRFDVVVLPSQRWKKLVKGRKAGTVPPQFTGGLGESGVAALREFVTAGGTLVTLNEASRLALEQLDLPIQDALKGLKKSEYYAPGSILALQVDTGHAIGRGMPRESIAWVERGPVFELKPGADSSRVTWVARFRGREPLLSGWLEGAERVQGKGALAVVRLGRGRVVLFGFRPQYRAQSLATYPLLFNALRWGKGDRAE